MSAVAPAAAVVLWVQAVAGQVNMQRLMRHQALRVTCLLLPAPETTLCDGARLGVLIAVLMALLWNLCALDEVWWRQF